MYWKDDRRLGRHDLRQHLHRNRVYQRAIFPLGQTYDGVSSSDLVRFREEAVDYGAAGWSFWDWQETTAAGLVSARRADEPADLA